MDIVICGLTITSSWGNGHATTWRALVGGLHRQGHRVTFLERDVPWYAAQRDCAEPEGCALHLYDSVGALAEEHGERIRDADAVIVGSYVPEGVEVGRYVQRTALGVAAFYDIDTPVTLAKLARGDHEYVDPELIRAYDLYLSFTGGPTLERLQDEHGARRVRPLYCSVDPERYAPVAGAPDLALGYLGTHSPDRQPKLDALLIEVARRLPGERFAVAGAGYTPDGWPANVEHRAHVAPGEHPAFYGRQRFTLNLTRADMVAAGWSPSVRLFEAAACGVPIVTDAWEGLSSFFVPGRECLVVESTEDVVGVLAGDGERIASAARARVLGAHTAEHRARELVEHLMEAE